MLFNVKGDNKFEPTRHKIARIDKSVDNRVILNQIEGVNPKFAKHMLLKNDLVRKYAMDVFGGIEILEQPVCKKCERPGTWHTGGTGYCSVCGTVTQNPITVRDYLLEELKFDEQTLAHMMKLLNRGGELIIDEGTK